MRTNDTKRYNRQFDDKSNEWVNILVSRSPKSAAPRINKKIGETGFDQHYHYILEKLSEGKKPSDIFRLLGKLGVTQNRSNFYRFLQKKRGE